MSKVSNDQKNKADSTKVRVDLMFDGLPNALEHVAAVMTYGAEKYEEHGWRQVEDWRYRAAKGRHALADSRGELTDNESGLLHLAHEATNILLLLQKKLESKGCPPAVWNKPPTKHKENV